MGDSCSTCSEENQGNQRSARVHFVNTDDPYADTDDYDTIQMMYREERERDCDAEELESALRGFREAIQNGNDSLAMYIDEDYPQVDMIDTPFNNGDYPLHCCMKMDMSRHFTLLQYLLACGKHTTNRQNKKTGDTPLHIACRQPESAAMVAMLLKFSADPEIKNHDKQTPLDVARALENPDPDTIKILSQEMQRLLAVHFLKKPTVEPEDDLIGLTDLDTPTSQSPQGIDSPSAGQTAFDWNHQNSPLIGDVGTDDRQNIAKDVELADALDGNHSLLMLTQEESRKLDAYKLAANKNPFGQLQKSASMMLNGMLEISETEDRIPDLEGWMEMGDFVKGGFKWRKKWVVVKGAFILWSDEQILDVDVSDSSHRKKFDWYFNLLSVSQIKPVKGSKTNWQFAMGENCDERKTQIWVWKASSVQKRDDWIAGIQHRKDMLDLYNGYIHDGGDKSPASETSVSEDAEVIDSKVSLKRTLKSGGDFIKAGPNLIKAGLKIPVKKVQGAAQTVQSKIKKEEDRMQRVLKDDW